MNIDEMSLSQLAKVLQDKGLHVDTHIDNVTRKHVAKIITNEQPENVLSTGYGKNPIAAMCRALEDLD